MARRVGGRNGGPELDAFNLVLGDGYDEMHDAHWRRAWERHRDEYLSPEYLAQHPGSRVWAWWQFDAPDDTPEELFPGSAGNDITLMDERDVAAVRFLHEWGFLVDEEREALDEKVRELESGGYSADFDQQGNWAHARAKADAGGYGPRAS